ncbi:autotransporter outer membrane beta-barrel domain-containing protein [Ferrovibrio terrae]|uniref:Autotransporter outer membrane beta-barrel domain-containing protein n=1 Tax=Ferrovibrio terrae TaxID=2594003 RepID=A0A516GXT0_9PROT|nr:autotransporter outer membrane beta-barrel domain-containing protein [Ferrovibrio terrae]QDO96326.1 autotransporter outer membrane beta-barrel domain-containing protein [Ferrovibrio terrae]
MLRKITLGLMGLGMMVSGSAFAASDVSNSGSGSAQVVTAIAAPIASAQTASLISGAIGGALSGGIGGFSPSGSTFSLTDSGNRAPNQTTYLNSRDTGRNAGAADKPFGVWLQGAYSTIDNGQVGAAADGTAINTVLGLDYKLSDRLVIGVGGIYENVDVDTNTLTGRGNVQSEGFGIAPYLGFQLTNRWSASLSGAYSWLSYDAKRTNNTVSGSYDATRWMLNGSLNGTYTSGKIVMMPQVGVMYLEEEADAFTESNGQVNASNTIKLGRLYAGGKVGYAMGTMMPYFKLIGEYDFEHPDALAIGNGTFTNDDDTGGKVGLGVDFFSAGPFSGNLEGTYDSLGRTDLDVWTISGRVRMRF